MPTHQPVSKKPGSLGLKASLVALSVGAGVLVALVSTHAQAADAAEGGRGGKRAEEVQQRFAAADTNHDGKLTKDEAKAGMPMVYKHFDEIDTAKTGSVTLTDLATFAKARRAKKAE